LSVAKDQINLDTEAITLKVAINIGNIRVKTRKLVACLFFVAK